MSIIDQDDWGDLEFNDIAAPKPTHAEKRAATATATAPSPPPQEPTPRRNPSAVLIFDLETIPDESRMESFPLPPLPSPKPRTREGLIPAGDAQTWTVAKLTAYLSETRPCEAWLTQLQTTEEASSKPRKGILDAIAAVRNCDEADAAIAADRQRLLSVTPEFCRICAAAWCWEDQEEITSITCDPQRLDATEKTLLKSIWTQIGAARTVAGFNILHFDIPVLLIRSMILNVKPPRVLDLTPWRNEICDLYLRRFPKGKSKDSPGKLKDLAPLYGVEVPAGDVEGSQVAALFKADRETLRGYVESDVAVTRDIYRKMKGYFF